MTVSRGLEHHCGFDRWIEPSPGHRYHRCAECHRQGVRRLGQRARERVLEAYGGACRCCGESEQAFLQIDHVYGGGRQHRREIGNQTYWWLIRNGFPEGFQILCANCNMAKAILGACPHAVRGGDARP